MLAAILLALVDTTLPNGLEVSVVADPTMPVVAAQLWYHVGSANEDTGSRGLAHLFEHLMFGGTEAHPKGEYSRFVTEAGGDDNAFTSEDETVYVSTFPPGALEGVLRREADRMRGLVVDQANLDNEKRIVTEELRLRTENDPVARLLVAAQHALLGTHPYAFDAAGSKDDVARATIDACRGFYDAYYRPGRAHLVVVGPVDPERTLALAREAFGPVPAGGRVPPEVPPLIGWRFPEALDLREDIPPVEVALTGMPLPAADDPDAAAVEVMLELLTGVEVNPFRSIVLDRREKALEAGIESIALRRGGGIVFYSASLPYRRRTTAFREIDRALSELDGLRWATAPLVEAAQRRLLLERLTGSYFAAEVADRVGTARFHRGDARRAFTWGERLDEVTPADVARVWNRFVRDGTRVRVYVKPERVPAGIRMFGWLYPLFS